jgi:hypothetical protein
MDNAPTTNTAAKYGNLAQYNPIVVNDPAISTIETTSEIKKKIQAKIWLGLYMITNNPDMIKIAETTIGIKRKISSALGGTGNEYSRRNLLSSRTIRISTVFPFRSLLMTENFSPIIMRSIDKM